MKLRKTTLILLGLIILSFLYIKTEANPAEQGKRLIVHKVQRGEELHLLAGYYLLNAREWGKIFDWNSDVIKNKHRIYPGQELRVYVNNNWQPPYNFDKYVKSIGRR